MYPVVNKAAQADSEMLGKRKCTQGLTCHLKPVTYCATLLTCWEEGIQSDHWPDCSMVLVVGFLVEVSTTQGWDSTP